MRLSEDFIHESVVPGLVSAMPNSDVKSALQKACEAAPKVYSPSLYINLKEALESLGEDVRSVVNQIIENRGGIGKFQPIPGLDLEGWA